VTWCNKDKGGSRTSRNDSIQISYRRLGVKDKLHPSGL